MNGIFSNSPAAYTVTTFGWLIRDAARASRNSRCVCSSSMVSVLPPFSTFSATTRCRYSSFARYTTPMPPTPILARIRKWAIRSTSTGGGFGLSGAGSGSILLTAMELISLGGEDVFAS